MKEQSMWGIVNNTINGPKKGIKEKVENIIKDVKSLIMDMEDISSEELIKIAIDLIQDEKIKAEGKVLLYALMKVIDKNLGELSPEKKDMIKEKFLSLVPKEVMEVKEKENGEGTTAVIQEEITSEIAVEAMAEVEAAAEQPTPISEINAPDRVVPSADLLAKGFSAT